MPIIHLARVNRATEAFRVLNADERIEFLMLNGLMYDQCGLNREKDKELSQ